MSDCGEYEKLISLYVDGELPEPEKTGLEAHMAECSRCRRLCDAFRAISLSLGEEAAPAGFSSGVMAAVKTQGESGASRAKKPGKSWPKYLALAACIALAALTTVRLALPSRSRTADAGGAQPAQFGIAAAPGVVETKDMPAEENGADAAMPYSLELPEPEEAVMLRVSGAAQTQTDDPERIAEFAKLLSFESDASPEEVSGEAIYLVSLEYEEGSETMSVWINGDNLFCLREGVGFYSAAGSAEDLLEAIG